MSFTPLSPCHPRTLLRLPEITLTLHQRAKGGTSVPAVTAGGCTTTVLSAALAWLPRQQTPQVAAVAAKVVHFMTFPRHMVLVEAADVAIRRLGFPAYPTRHTFGQYGPFDWRDVRAPLFIDGFLSFDQYNRINRVPYRVSVPLLHPAGEVPIRAVLFPRLQEGRRHVAD